MNSSEWIKKFLHERLDSVPDDMTSETKLIDLGVDSLMLAELMFEAEDNLGITIDSDVALPQTVGDMTALFDELVARKKV
jgi:acyl carrier protein